MAYVLEGVRWPEDPDGGATIAWSFAPVRQNTPFGVPVTRSIEPAEWQAVVRDAFAAWTLAADLAFVELPSAGGAEPADIRLGFSDFGATSTIGGTAWFGNEGIILPGALVVLQDPAVEPIGRLANGEWGYVELGVSLKQVLAHEIGHAIGLEHSPDPADLMYPVAIPQVPGIGQDDAAGARSLYGFARVFDGAAYLRANPDVVASGLDPWTHHATYGWREGRDGAAWFDDAAYLARNPDVAAAGLDPLGHYLGFGRAEGRTTADAAGRAIGRDGFDAQRYLMEHPDVARSGIDPRRHYDSSGWREGRDPNGWFDAEGYLATYRDVAAAALDPLAHYAAWGWREGRDPSRDFDTQGYLAAHADVAAAGINPLEHFLRFGLAEGRAAAGDNAWG